MGTYVKSKPPKRKMNSKQRHKIKPVYLLLTHSMLILPLLVAHSMGKNMIYTKLRQMKKPGLNNKFDTLDSIYHLQRAGLIKEQEENIKQLQELTPLGRELAEMIIGLDRYKKSWLTLEDAYDNNFTKHEEKDRHILSRILRTNGWNEEEIEWFDHYNDRLGVTLDYAYEFFIPNVLRERFELIVNNSEKIGEITKMIIDNLRLNEKEYHIPILLQDIEEDYCLTFSQGEDVTRYIDLYAESLDYFREASGQDYYPNPVFNEVKNMLLSMLIMLKPPKELVLEWIQQLKSGKEKQKCITTGHEEEYLAIEEKRIQQLKSGEEKELLMGLTEKKKNRARARTRRILYESSRSDSCVLSAYEEYLNKLA